MEMILHGQRIATNGDVRLMPTPEQWDFVATLKDRHAEKPNDRLTAKGTSGSVAAGLPAHHKGISQLGL